MGKCRREAHLASVPESNTRSKLRIPFLTEGLFSGYVTSSRRLGLARRATAITRSTRLGRHDKHDEDGGIRINKLMGSIRD